MPAAPALRQRRGMSPGGLPRGRKTTNDPNHSGAPRPNPLEPGQDLPGVQGHSPERPGPGGGPPGGGVAQGGDHPRRLCSPLSRARDTADAIARHHNLAVADLPGLTDLCYGDWEGMPLAEVKVRYAELYRQWETAPPQRPVSPGRNPGRSEGSGDGRRWRRWCSATPARLSCWRPTGR